MKVSLKKRFNLIKNHLYLTCTPKLFLQRKNPRTIPIIIVNYNQLANLKILVQFLLDRKFENVVIIDNQSSYKPLLAFYEEIRHRVKIERMPKNYGHTVFFKNKNLQQKYGKGYYVVTDPDMALNPDLPADFMRTLISHLHKNFSKVTKVGFALELESIPDYYPLKEKVINWEKVYWKDQVAEDVYQAIIDTTFALYKPGFPNAGKEICFYAALRIAGNFTARHMGWYIDPTNLTKEQAFYMQTASNSSSWNMTENGQLVNSDAAAIYQ